MYYNYGQPMYPTRSSNLEPSRITPLSEAYTTQNERGLTSSMTDSITDYFSNNKWWIIALVVLFIVIIIAGVVFWKKNKTDNVVSFDGEY
jgi:hypothetical protein